MGRRDAGHELVGREAETDAVRAWWERVRSGAAGLLVRGEPGIGKTSVWSAAVDHVRASGGRVLVSRPVEAELALGYAGLGDLLLPVADEVLPELTAAHARALNAALSLAVDPEPGNPVLVGRATHAALTHLATNGPIAVAVDDVQWLDGPSARALAFAARRLGGASVGIVVALRDGFDDPLGLSEAFGERHTELRLAGLSFGALGHLLRSRVDEDLPRRRLLRIHEQAGGNPYFALELASGAATRSLPSSLDELIGRRLDAAAAGHAAIEAVAVLGPLPVGAFDDPVGLDAAVAATVLADQNGEIRFAHPLLAAGAYGRIPPARRAELHRRAASSTDSLEERARHLALAASGPDAAVARLLDEAARLARARGAPETAAELMAEARRLTPAGDPDELARRAMDQAEYLVQAADEPAARTLVDEILAGPARGAVRVRALVQRALTSVDARAAVSALEAAVAEPHDDSRLAARTLAQLAWQRGAWLGDLEPALAEALAAVAQADALDDAPTLVATLGAAGLLLSIAGRSEAAEMFRRAVEIIDRTPSAAGDHTPRLAFAHERWWRGDFDAAEALLREERRLAEEHGDDGLLMRLNVFGAEFAMRRGRWDEAGRLLEEALVDARDYWRVTALVQRAILRGRRGDRLALDDVDEIRNSPGAAADPIVLAAADFVTGIVEHDRGRPADAADRVLGLTSPTARAGSRAAEFAALVPETVVVLVEAGRLAEASALALDLDQRAAQLAPWGTAAASFCNGLVAHAESRAEDALLLLRSAREGFASLGAPWELALALLAEGSVLRRLGRRREAAGPLDAALAVFRDLGAEPMARRTENELRRARPRPRRDDSLTEAETRVALLVADGLTNREVAARNFTTVATIEAHLTRIYSKVGVRSRTELARRVSDGSLRLSPERAREVRE